MGLLDGNLLGGADLTDPRLALAAGLLGGRGNLGANLGVGLLGAQSEAKANQQFALTQQAAERANRANDLQQISGLYSILKQQEFGRMLQARQTGQPYTPNPMLGQLEQKLGQLAGVPQMSANPAPFGGGASSPPPQGMDNMPSIAAPANAGPMPSMPAPQMPGNTQPAPMPSVSPQSQQPSQPQVGDVLGGPAFGIPMEAYLAQDPTGGKYLEALQKQGTPISTRYGVYTINPKNPSQVQLAGGMVPPNAMPVQMGPNGPSIAPLPGQLDTQKAIASAAEAGKAPYDIKMVTNASGAQVPVSVAQLVEGRSPQVPPAVSAAAASGKPFEATQAPGGPVQFSPNPGQADPFADIPKRYQPQGLGQTTFDREMAGEQAKSASALATKLGTQADMANQRIALNSQALDMVDKSTTGPRAASIADVQKWLVERAHIPEQTLKDAGAGSPSATIALQKDLLNAATQKAKQQFGSRITQSEVMLMLTRGAPNVDMTKASIKFLLQSDNAMLGYQVKQADDFGTYLQKGGDPMRFEAWYARKFPASQALGNVHLNTGQPSIDDLVNKYKSK